jgi:hypothetical protein
MPALASSRHVMSSSWAYARITLNERDVARVVEMLRGNGVLFEAAKEYGGKILKAEHPDKAELIDAYGSHMTPRWREMDSNR